ncbi:MAG TPA: transposase [Gammaproteobacteria bacterium]|nr:transposase [Gammaproteobacteria bacterium]
MNAPQRETVLQSIIKTCEFSNWHLHAAHVRTNHMHIVVSAQKEPEKIAVSLKAYATRYLKQQYPELNRKKYWSKGESTGYIFQSENLFRAIQYTIEEQGNEMAFYCEPAYYDVLSH